MRLELLPLGPFSIELRLHCGDHGAEHSDIIKPSTM
jgi:hypothetical protein